MWKKLARVLGVAVVVSILATIGASAAPPEVTPIAISFDELAAGPLEVPYRANVLSFQTPVIVVEQPARAGNSMRAAFCGDDAGLCPTTISIEFRDPLVEVSMWIAAAGDPLEPVLVEAFNGLKQLVDSATSSPADLEFEVVSLRGAGIRTIVAEVPKNPDRSFYIDDLSLLPQIAALSVDPSSVQFGSIPVGTVATKAVTITNEGNVDLSLRFSPVSDAIGIEGCDEPVLVGGSCRLDLTLDTQQETSLSQLLRVTDETGVASGELKITADVMGPIVVSTTSPPVTTSAPSVETTVATSVEATVATTVAPTVETTTLSVLPGPEPAGDEPLALMVGVGILVAAVLGTVAFVHQERSPKDLRMPLNHPQLEDRGAEVEPLDGVARALPFRLVSAAVAIEPIAQEDL